MPAPVSRLGKVTGIIHGAGTLVDKLIEKKTETDFETVYTPKVAGLENMLRSVDVARLDFLVLFSSIVGFYGNVGQSDYAIANEILNKSAYLLKRKLPGLPRDLDQLGPVGFGHGHARAEEGVRGAQRGGDPHRSGRAHAGRCVDAGE